MSGLVRGVAHAAVTVTESKLQEELDFYIKGLGMKVLREWDHIGGYRAYMLEAGHSIVEVFSDAPSDLDKGVVGHFALDVEDVDEAVEIAEKYGCQIILEPATIVIAEGSESELPARLAFINTPGGAEIEFFKEL